MILCFLSIYLLLFADDIVLFTTNPATLQAQINNLCRYSNEWGLKINISKTKFCVFRSVNEPIYADITINGETIEQVDNFIYLGVNFHYNGKMNSAVTTLHDQALKAYYNLLTLFDKINLDIKCKLSLFDSMIVPIILYGSEVWGIYNFKAVEKLHQRFCRKILGVSQQTPNYAIYGELGRFPLYILAKERSIGFYLKLLKKTRFITF